MPAGRPPSRTHAEFVEAAIALADEFGLPALTLKSLGAAVGVSTPAVYRYCAERMAAHLAPWAAQAERSPGARVASNVRGRRYNGRGPSRPAHGR